MSIYDVPALITKAHARSFTPSNIASAFRKTGIFPFDRQVLSDEDFCPSSVTDRVHITGDCNIVGNNLNHFFPKIAIYLYNLILF